jgi:hypothetical protein
MKQILICNYYVLKTLNCQTKKPQIMRVILNASQTTKEIYFLLFHSACLL